MAHPLLVVPGNRDPHRDRWGYLLPVHIPSVTLAAKAKHPALAVPSVPRLVLAEPVSPGFTGGMLCCRTTSLWI